MYPGQVSHRELERRKNRHQNKRRQDKASDRQNRAYHSFLLRSANDFHHQRLEFLQNSHAEGSQSNNEVRGKDSPQGNLRVGLKSSGISNVHKAPLWIFLFRLL